MAQHIYQCTSCKKYTLESSCPACHSATFMPKPPKFSLDDKYAGLRREVKRAELRKKGLY